MAVQPGVWGIDIGQCALKAVRLQLIDGVVTATAFDYVEHPKILSQPDANPDELTREALEKFLSRNALKGDRVAIGVPGQSGLARFVKLPPVEEKKIDDIVRFEAKQQIPFPLEEVVWDYQKVSDGVVEGGFAIDTEIGLFAMKRDMINRFLNHFQNVNVEVHVIQMSPLALCNYITYDHLNKGAQGVPATPEAGAEAAAAPAPPVIGGKKKCVVALDIGTDGSNLIITDGGKIIWQRPIPIGGNHFTRALTKELKLTFAKAEHLKRNAAKSPELANILKALKPVLTDFVGEVQRSLGYFTNTHRDAQVEYMAGLGSAFKLPGLQKYLGDKLQIRIEKPSKFNRLVGEAVTNAPVFMENMLTFPVAFGLALQGLGAARLGTNLLPPEISWDRKIRAKKPWAVAAAAMLLLGSGVLAFGYSLPYAAVNDPTIGVALKKGKDAEDQANDVAKEITAKKAEVKQGVEKIQAVLAGKDERKNWLSIYGIINSCLPIPGPGGNMTQDPNLVKLWDSIDGVNGGPRRATALYLERISKGIDPKEAARDDDMRQYLAAIDVEAIHCRYCPNLEVFFRNAKKYCIDWVGSGLVTFNGMSDEEREPMMREQPVFPKDEKGWVFEIRGTTWYDLGTVHGGELVTETLFKNLKKRAAEDAVRAKQLKDNPAKDNSKKTDIPEGFISHVFIYNVWRDDDPRPDSYNFIDGSLIDDLVVEESSSSSTGPNSLGGLGGPVRGGGDSASGWKPISSGTASSRGAGGYKRSSSSLTPKGTTDQKDGQKIKSKPRYEFVILFVWKEYTPSDRFMPKPAAGTPQQDQKAAPAPGKQLAK